MLIRKTSGIYKILNTKTGDFYIGSAVDICKRWRLHLFHLRTGTHCNQHLQRSWDKYGSSKFFFSVLCFVDDKSALLEKEQMFLDKENPTFNICRKAGSALGRKATEESRRNMSNAQKGHGVTEEARKNMSISHLGKPSNRVYVTSDETKKKLSLAHAGKTLTAEHRLAIGRAMSLRRLTEDHKKKIGIANKLTPHRRGFKHSEETIRRMSKPHKKKSHAETDI